MAKQLSYDQTEDISLVYKCKNYIPNTYNLDWNIKSFNKIHY